VKVSRAADERATALVKAKEAVCGAGDADARAFAEDYGGVGTGSGDRGARSRDRTARNGCPTVIGAAVVAGGGAGGDRAEPERARGAEVGAIEGAVDAQGGGEASGPAGEVEEARGFAMPLHLGDALEGLEGANQNATADTGDFRANVEHKVVAVAEIDVGVAAAKKHGAVARGRSAKMVRGGIALRIGLGFDDATAKPAAGEFADDNFADEKAGQRDRVRGKFGAAEAPHGNGSFGGGHGWQGHGWQVRQSSRAARKSNLTPYGGRTTAGRVLLTVKKRIQLRVGRFLDMASERLNNEESMSVRAGGAEDMFLDVKDLAVRKLPIRKNYAPGSIDYQTAEIKQIEPLEVNATAELLDGQIRIAGDIETKVELVCARCLEPVVEEVSRAFDLFYSPLPKGEKPEEARLKEDDAEIGFFEGEGLFLADVLREQVLLALPMKVICRSDCRGLCPNCGANLNHEECRCETHATDPRLAPLARLRQDWLKKQ
jgi:uncharacterized protein